MRTSFLFSRALAATIAACVAIGVSACSLTVETIARRDGTGTEADGSVDGSNPFDSSSDADGSSDSSFDADADDVTADGVPADGSDAGDVSTDAGDSVDVGEVCVPETCNGIDDNCDGQIDNLPPSTCGVGACRNPAVCTGGVMSCATTPGQPEICNNVDDDCDGTVDDGIPGPTCGFGACQVTVANGCTAGVPSTCTPGTPGTEICDGIDNNCDGRIDENCPCDRYVVPNGLGTGTSPTSPMGSIQAAINSVPAGTRARICVGATLVTGTCSPAMFLEAITMHEGVSVFGGYQPGTTWVRNAACVTQIVNTNVNGVFFGHAMTNATQLDGFTILGLAGATGLSQTAAITIQEGATITNNTIIPGAGLVSLGIFVTAPTRVAARPLIALNTFQSAPLSGIRDTVAIRVTVLAAEIRGNSYITAGSASGLSMGVDLVNAPGTIVSDNTIASGSAPASTGLHATGDVTNVMITRNTILGGVGVSTSPTPVRGIGLDACTAGVATIFANSRIAGGPGATTGIGIDVTGCSVRIDSNAAIVGKAASSTEAAGIRCGGGGTLCIIDNNAQVVGFGATATGSIGRGVWINAGAVGTVQFNRGLQGCTAVGSTNCHGVIVESAAPGTIVDSNVLDAQRGSWANGILIRRTVATVSNNLVFASASNGITLDTAGGPTLEPIVHSNTVVGVATAGSTTSVPTNLIAIDNEAASVSATGIIRNNNLVCLGTSTNRFAIGEYGAFSDPRILENNNLFGCETLYLDADGARLLTSIALINTLPDVPSVSNNVSYAPLFVSGTDYHLQGTSRLIDIGTGTGAPLFDFDAEPRPARGGVDIGYDEVTP